jgi:putative ABC transport system permease protein
LTALGVIIGVASVVASVALGQGAQASVERSINSLGSNLLIVVPGAQRSGGFSGGAGGANTLTLRDADAIASEVANVDVVAPTQRAGGQIVADGANWQTRIEGVTPEFQIARDWSVASGRFIEDRDVRQARSVVVLGATVAKELFASLDPVGQQVRIQRGSYEVIGVLDTKGQGGFGQDQDDLVIAPISTVKRRIAGRFSRPDTVSQISIQASQPDAIAQVQEDIEALLRQRHRIQTGEADDFTVQNVQTIAQAAEETTRVFTYLLGGIAGVSLLVGGVGIMNIMLVSVTERTREIGLRKALGARRRDILAQFGLEAVALSLVGGLIGLGLGAAIAWGITQLADLPLILGAQSAAMAFVFSAVVGVVFGAYPAWRAARLDPIEALRRE